VGFSSGFAFKYRENSPFWDKLLKGKNQLKHGQNGG
jgi:hypothetical protein